MAIEPGLPTIVWLTMQTTAAALTLSALLGVPLGVWLGLTHFRGKKLMAALVYTGMGFPPVVIGLVVYMLLSRSGPLAFLNWLFTPQAIVLAQVIIALPLIAGITLSSVAAVPDELPMQLTSLGATTWQARWTILWEARSGVLIALAAGFGRIISEVGAALMVGGNILGHTRVLTTAIVLETNAGRFGFALALGGWLIALTFLVNLIILRLQGRPVRETA
jgi:tungstate transport system permease protein